MAAFEWTGTTIALLVAFLLALAAAIALLVRVGAAARAGPVVSRPGAPESGSAIPPPEARDPPQEPGAP